MRGTLQFAISGLHFTPHYGIFVWIASNSVTYFHLRSLGLSDLVHRSRPLRVSLGGRLFIGLGPEPSAVPLVALLLLLGDEVIVVFLPIANEIFLATHFGLLSNLANSICVPLFAGLEFYYFAGLFVSQDEVNVKRAHA